MVKTVRVMRHGLAVRVAHWAIVIEGAFLILTGFQIGGILDLGLPENTYSYHVIVGISFMGTAFVFLYTVLAAHDWRWFTWRRIPYSIRYIASEALYWFRLRPPLEDPIKYDTKRHDYVEKLIPSVVVVWWAYLLMGIALSVTGLSDAFPAQFWFFYDVLNWLGLTATGVGGLPFILAVHRLVAVLLIVTVALHLYASVLYHVVPSIFRGKKDEPVADGADALPLDPPSRLAGSDPAEGDDPKRADAT
jgi:methanophenazine hydrogenase, cytochrome b subunit